MAGTGLIAAGPSAEGSDNPETRAAALADHGPAWTGRANVTPQDIAEGMAFLCGDSADFISGCQLPYMWR